MKEDYSDIIDMKHHQSARHPHMSLLERAGQFAPFAALSTHAAHLRETARLTQQETILDKDQQEILQRRLLLLGWMIEEHPVVSIRYFVPDPKKQGGSYRQATGRALDLRQLERQILLEGHGSIPLDHVVDIDGAFLDNQR